MPYIKPIHRDRFCYEDAGDLNYALTRVCLDYLHAKSLSHPRIKINYQRINDIVGALDCCKIEFMRRVMFDYENEKIQTNGDVGYEAFSNRHPVSSMSEDIPTTSA